MLLIILAVGFFVVLLLWFLSMIGKAGVPAEGSPWLAFIAVLILGIVVFLMGSGVIVVERQVETHPTIIR